MIAFAHGVASCQRWTFAGCFMIAFAHRVASRQRWTAAWRNSSLCSGHSTICISRWNMGRSLCGLMSHYACVRTYTFMCCFSTVSALNSTVRPTLTAKRCHAWCTAAKQGLQRLLILLCATERNCASLTHCLGPFVLSRSLLLKLLASNPVVSSHRNCTVTHQREEQLRTKTRS